MQVSKFYEKPSLHVFNEEGNVFSVFARPQGYTQFILVTLNLNI